MSEISFSQNPNEFELEVIRLSESFQINGTALSKLPFVMDQDGRPHKIINDFIRHRAIREGKDIESTVYQDALNIVITYNALSKLVRGIETRWSKRVGLDIEMSSASNRFHRIWLNSSRSRLRKLLKNWQVEKRKEDYKPGTLNSYVRSYVRFLWWTDKSGYSNNLIGIHGKDTPFYPVPVEKPKTTKKSVVSAEYHIPWLLDEPVTTPRKRRAIIKKTDMALKGTYDRSQDMEIKELSSTVAERDYLMFRTMREAGLRISELVTMKKSPFLSKPQYDETGQYVYIPTSQTKGTNKNSRVVEFPKDLYIAIKDFIDEEINDELIPETRRDKLTKEDKEYLFVSSKTGKPLVRQSMNTKLKVFDLSPHDLRKVNLTEAARVLIDAGLDKPTTMLLLGEIAGHSPNSKGKTVEHHYVQAFELAKRAEIGSIGSLKAEINSKDLEIERLIKENEKLQNRLSDE